MGLCGVSVGKGSACNAGDLDSDPGFGRFPGERNVYPLQYTCLENFMDRKAWQATVQGVTKGLIQVNMYVYTSFLKIIFPC